MSTEIFVCGIRALPGAPGGAAAFPDPAATHTIGGGPIPGEGGGEELIRSTLGPGRKSAVGPPGPVVSRTMVFEITGWPPSHSHPAGRHFFGRKDFRDAPGLRVPVSFCLSHPPRFGDRALWVFLPRKARPGNFCFQQVCFRTSVVLFCPWVFDRLAPPICSGEYLAGGVPLEKGLFFLGSPKKEGFGPEPRLQGWGRVWLSGGGGGGGGGGALRCERRVTLRCGDGCRARRGRVRLAAADRNHQRSEPWRSQ